VEAVAARLGMSRRTLQRRLKEEDVVFKELVDTVRRRMALRYMENPALGLAEIAFLCGFSEPAAFTRAFRRWTGSAPRDYRRRSA